MIEYIVMALFCYFVLSGKAFEFASDSFDSINGIDSNSPSAGFEVLFGLTGAGLGFIGGVLICIAIAILVGLCLYLLPGIITGIIAQISYKKKAKSDVNKCISSFNVDGYVKAIMNGIICLFALIFLLTNRGDGFVDALVSVLVGFCNYIAVFILSVIQIIKVNEIKGRFDDNY